MDTKQKLIATLHEQADVWLSEVMGIEDTKMAKLIAEFTYENRQLLATRCREIYNEEAGNASDAVRTIFHVIKDG